MLLAFVPKSASSPWHMSPLPTPSPAPYRAITCLGGHQRIPGAAFTSWSELKVNPSAVTSVFGNPLLETHTCVCLGSNDSSFAFVACQSPKTQAWDALNTTHSRGSSCSPPASPGVRDTEGEATERLSPAPSTTSPQPNPRGPPEGWGHTHTHPPANPGAGGWGGSVT